MTSSDSPKLRFAAVPRELTLAGKVAQAITDMILSEALPPDHKLPSERELAEQFGVSRTVVREAVRSVVARGLLESQSGRGLTVAKPSGAAVKDSLSLLVRSLDPVGYGKVDEVRMVLETAIAGLAAERASDAEVARLRALCAELGATTDPAQAARLDVEFHRTLAQVTDNELFLVLLGSISDVLLDVRVQGFHDRDAIEYAATAHEEILDRIAAHDVEGAIAQMRLHLEESQRRLARRSPEQPAPAGSSG